MGPTLIYFNFIYRFSFLVDKVVFVSNFSGGNRLFARKSLNSDYPLIEPTGVVSLLTFTFIVMVCFSLSINYCV